MNLHNGTPNFARVLVFVGYSTSREIQDKKHVMLDPNIVEYSLLDYVDYNMLTESRRQDVQIIAWKELL